MKPISNGFRNSARVPSFGMRNVYIGLRPRVAGIRDVPELELRRSNFAINNRSERRCNGNLSSKLDLELRRKRYARTGTEQVDKSNTWIFAAVRGGRNIEDTVGILIHPVFLFFFFWSRDNWRIYTTD